MTKRTRLSPLFFSTNSIVSENFMSSTMQCSFCRCSNRTAGWASRAHKGGSMSDWRWKRYGMFVAAGCSFFDRVTRFPPRCRPGTQFGGGCSICTAPRGELRFPDLPYGLANDKAVLFGRLLKGQQHRTPNGLSKARVALAERLETLEPGVRPRCPH